MGVALVIIGSLFVALAVVGVLLQRTRRRLDRIAFFYQVLV